MKQEFEKQRKVLLVIQKSKDRVCFTDTVLDWSALCATCLTFNKYYDWSFLTKVYGIVSKSFFPHTYEYISCMDSLTFNESFRAEFYW